MPKIKARFRRYHGVPFAIEQFTGTQYRCRACNQIYLKKTEFENHLRREAKNATGQKALKKCPQVDTTIQAKVLYSRNFYDTTRRDFLHLQEGVTYDPDP